MAELLYKAALAGYRALRRRKNRLLNLIDPPVVVLTYHRVTSLKSDPQQLAVSPAHFRGHLRYLKEHVRLVRFEEDWTALREPAVALTFDDGYADNLLEALPILAEAEVPATFFISTGSIGSDREFWWDELERLVLAEQEYPGQFSLADHAGERTWLTATEAQRQVLYQELYPLIFKLPAARRQAWLDRLREWGGLGLEGRAANRPLTPAELRQLAQSRWATIGAHTVSHARLSALEAAQQQREIVASRDYLAEQLGKPIKVFSYPFGSKADYNGHSRRICRAAGFSKAAANFPGQAHRWTDNWQIPRQLVRDWDLATFSTRLRSFWV